MSYRTLMPPLFKSREKKKLPREPTATTVGYVVVPVNAVREPEAMGYLDRDLMRRLVALCEAGKSFYLHVLWHVRSEALRECFADLALVHVDMSEALAAHLGDAGMTRATGTRFDRLTDSFDPADGALDLGEVLEAEDSALDAFRSARILGSDSVRSVLERHAAPYMIARARVRELSRAA